MFTQLLNIAMYGAIFISLFLVDYILGNGFVDMSQKVFCKIVCFIKKSILEEAKLVDQMTGSESPISLPIIFTEILILTLTIAVGSSKIIFCIICS